MKILRYTYMIVLAAMTAVMAACSSDDDALANFDQQSQDGMAQVTLHVSPASSTAFTRDGGWQDGNATNDEMMNIWVVVITDNSNVVEKVLACKPIGQDREIDAITSLPLGAHKFYSFANMSVATVASTLGITVTMPTMPKNDVVYEATAASGNVDANKAVKVSGNGFNKFANIDNNGFGSEGIPMSNVQSATIVNNTTMDLIVVRMMAKMELQFYNLTGKALKVVAATLSDITKNALTGDDPDNLKLLPLWTSTTGKDNMNVVLHGDLQPNLNGTPATEEVTFEPGEPIQVPATANNTSTASAYKMTFYINESATPTNPEGLFYLTLTLQDEYGKNTELRYSLINQSGKTSIDDNAWDYIARNDYRIIPIVIDDYKLELIPYDFPPIGVYPASVKEIGDNLYEMTFHDYGHFHLVPKVTKISNNTVVDYSSSATPSGTAWTLNTDFAGSWYTAATKGGAWLTDAQITSNGFYRDQTAATDGDDAGGAPVWYANTSSPQWDPAGGTTYNPFIFGYIADPDAAWWALDPSSRTDKQIYHEFRVKLFVGGAYRRDLIYRFYMTLSKDQMLGSRSLTPMPRKKH